MRTWHAIRKKANRPPHAFSTVFYLFFWANGTAMILSNLKNKRVIMTAQVPLNDKKIKTWAAAAFFENKEGRC